MRKIVKQKHQCLNGMNSVSNSNISHERNMSNPLNAELVNEEIENSRVVNSFLGPNWLPVLACIQACAMQFACV